jgi:DNA-binding LacI/PurR family transcriptional regulator
VKPERPRRPKPQRITSADVAAAAGVSRATVSYVLNGVHDRISEQTRTRVYAAAESLGYVPNAMASALRAGRTEIVLLALPSWPLGPAVAEWVSTGVAELERIGYTPLVHLRQGDDSNQSLARACDRVRPVGIIGPAEALSPERVVSLYANGTRAVLAISREPLEHVATLVFDQALVGETAIAHLVERGHRDIVAIVPSEPQFTAIGAERLRGARAVASAHGVTLHAVDAACSMADVGRALAPVLPLNPTALYAFNDDYAFAAIEALEASGHEVPGDVAVIGCDDSAAARRTKMTTIALGDPRRWEQYVERLHALIEGADDRTPMGDPPRLVPGSTT